MVLRRTQPALLALIVTLLAGGCSPIAQAQERSDWPGWYAYGGDAGGTRYAPLDQIHRANVDSLEVAWTYRTGELGQGSPVQHKLTFEATPILFEGTLYLSTAFGKVIALDPATGAERWTHDPKVSRLMLYAGLTSRGVSAWRDPEAEAGQPCAGRIFTGTIDARLVALDAATGKRCEDFGDGGQVDLAEGLRVIRGVGYQVTSPPAIVKGLVVVGSSVGDNWHADAGSGVVRAFDARTGVLRWRWDPIPREPGLVGAANAWSMISADPERDLVFVPTTSPSPDFYGGLRPGDNRYANSVVALRASTGEVVWHFQTVHHDLWDYDLAAQPALVTVMRDGQEIPAVAQATKMGWLFLLHRETGEPLFRVEERPVPQSVVAGEQSWPTQPFPTRPRALVPQGPLTPDDAWGRTDADREACRALFAQYRSEGIFTPPSLEGTIMVPGNGAGTNWGSVAFDPERGLLVLNTSQFATLVQLIPRDDVAEVRRESSDYEFADQWGTPYAMRRKTLLSPGGQPCSPPPWGTLAAIDLATGEVPWEVPLDANGGWPIVTAGGLVFIGATFDNQFRSFDVETGEELWSTTLPRSGIATPMTYQLLGGKQYVVIAAGGHGLMGLPTGDYVIAFALP